MYLHIWLLDCKIGELSQDSLEGCLQLGESLVDVRSLSVVLIDHIAWILVELGG